MASADGNRRHQLEPGPHCQHDEVGRWRYVYHSGQCRGRHDLKLLWLQSFEFANGKVTSGIAGIERRGWLDQQYYRLRGQ